VQVIVCTMAELPPPPPKVKKAKPNDPLPHHYEVRNGSLWRFKKLPGKDFRQRDMSVEATSVGTAQPPKSSVYAQHCSNLHAGQSDAVQWASPILCQAVLQATRVALDDCRVGGSYFVDGFSLTPSDKVRRTPDSAHALLKHSLLQMYSLSLSIRHSQMIADMEVAHEELRSLGLDVSTGLGTPGFFWRVAPIVDLTAETVKVYDVHTYKNCWRNVLRLLSGEDGGVKCSYGDNDEAVAAGAAALVQLMNFKTAAPALVDVGAADDAEPEEVDCPVPGDDILGPVNALIALVKGAGAKLTFDAAKLTKYENLKLLAQESSKLLLGSGPKKQLKVVSVL
jgi:hypothetical protein